MKTLGKLLLAALAVSVISACGTKPTVTEDTGAVVEDRTQAAPGGPGADAEADASTRALPGRDGIAGSQLDDPASPLAARVIYFDYDQSEIREEFRALISAHAAFLASNPDESVVLEGHTDERGSREYNIGLGERRGESVRRLLLFQGATDKQVRTVSYGEERPAENGHGEDAWAKNRRVELIYKR